MRAWIVGILLILGGFILVIALWLLGYHLTGKWAFNQWKAERVAMGDRFGWPALRPQPVEPSQNFAEADLIKGAIPEKGPINPKFKALAIPKEMAEKLGNWMEGRRDDLHGIALTQGSDDLKSFFLPLDATIKELDKASLRPGNCFPLEYEEGEYPALIGFRGAIRTLRVRALANLKSGHPDQALEDIQICFRIAEHLRTEPQLISALLRSAILGVTMQVVWEGLEDHLWPADHLEKIQTTLSKIDLLETMNLAWQAERQGIVDCFSATAENKPLPKFMRSPGDRQVRLGALGRGWFYRNLLVYCQWMTSLIDVQDPKTHRVFPDKQIDPVSWEKKLRFRLDLVMARIAIPALAGQGVRMAKRQALIDEAIVVCALERYRLQNGCYPDRLEDLPPQLLIAPQHDLVSGAPMHYRREGDSFILYEVGWDGRDDNGKIAWSTEEKIRAIDYAKGDWVWPHAEH